MVEALIEDELERCNVRCLGGITRLRYGLRKRSRATKRTYANHAL
ncbi:MAG: hypothetical protein QOH24_1290 [Verrucomicrobiota bacterium]